MTSSKCKTSKSKSKRKKTASTTSPIKWIKDVEFKLDGGQITSYDLNVGHYRLHIWQMYNSENPWNWVVSDERNTFQICSTRRDLDTPQEAKGAALKAFAWFFTMKLLRKSNRSDKVLRDHESRIYWK